MQNNPLDNRKKVQQNLTEALLVIFVSECHNLTKYEPMIKEFLLEVFVEQFVFGEVKCKLSAASPVRQLELLQNQCREDGSNYFCCD